MADTPLSMPSSKFVICPPLPEVERLIKNLDLSSFIDHSKTGRDQTRQAYDEAVKVLRQWLCPILNLNEYFHVYPKLGVTHAIESWLREESRTVNRLRGDYSWPSIIDPNVNVISHWREFDDGVLYISNPSAIDGNFISDWDEILESQIPIVLDVAYIGTTGSLSIPINTNIEKVFYSFSKGFGLHSLRIGWCFSRTPMEPENVLNEVSYHSLYSLKLTEEICKRFTPNFLSDYFLIQQEKICKNLGLQTSDSVLLGYSEEGSLSDFERENCGLARVPLTEFFQKPSYVT